MIRPLLYAAMSLILFSCSDQSNLFGGYSDPEYFKYTGLDKNPIGLDIHDGLDDDYFKSYLAKNNVPKIFILGYYTCPQMCNSFREVLFPELIGLGSDFEVLMLSINPDESKEDASIDADKYFSLYFDQDLRRENFNFIVSAESTIKNVTEKLGFKYKYDIETGEYFHPTMAYLLLPDGRVSDIIDFGEQRKSIKNKIDLANTGYILDIDEFESNPLTCMIKDIENKNPKKAFNLAQFTGGWFVSCSVFCLGYSFLSRREKNRKK